MENKKKNKEESLRILYSQVHACKKCHNISNGNIKSDPEKVPRILFPDILKSRVFIAAQSLASKQVRLSGIPFHDCNEKMSKGGTFLETYLN